MGDPLLAGAEAPVLTSEDGVRLVLARHGQTSSNVRHALDTVPPGPGLTEFGRRQAEDMAEHLAQEDIVAVRSSKALRAWETAAPVARRHALEIEVVDGIQEIYVGDLEGTSDEASRQRFEEIYAGWHFGWLDRSMPGGENGHQVLDRFFGAARDAARGVASGVVVLVSHGAMLRLAASCLASDVSSRRSNSAYLPNTGMIVLEASGAEPSGWRCVRWDGLDIE